MLDESKNFDLMKNKEKDWSELYNNLKIQKIEFLPDIIKYQLEYFKFLKVIDYSMVMYSDTKPLALSPIYVIQDKDKTGKFAPKNLKAPSFGINNKKKRFKIYSEYLDIINKIKEKHKIKKINFDIDCLYQLDIEFMSFLLEKEFKIESSKTIILTKIDSMHTQNNKDYRKSYKSLINSNIKNYDLLFLNHSNFKKDVWESFKRMHFKVSGKKTRTDETWNIQEQSILNKNGILIYLKKKEKFLGFAFFFTSKTNALYASAAYDTEQNRKIPIGHLIHDFAISYFTKNEILNYYIGFKENKVVKKNIKEDNILLFKKGFANSFSSVLTLSR